MPEGRSGTREAGPQPTPDLDLKRPVTADGRLFRLAAEAGRIRLAPLFAPNVAIHASRIEPLPHQITAVYGPAARKLETSRFALGGRVYDVLGRLFEGVGMRDLLMDAVRYGERPEVKARLFERVDGAADRKRLLALLEDRALARRRRSASLPATPCSTRPWASSSNTTATCLRKARCCWTRATRSAKARRFGRRSISRSQYGTGMNAGPAVRASSPGSFDSRRSMPTPMPNGGEEPR